MKRNPEADEINDEDLEAASNFFERLIANTATLEKENENERCG